MPIRLKDYYQILEVPVAAGSSQIRRAYLKLARKYHPDVNPDNVLAEERFKEVQEAYRVLSDPERRRVYDEQSRPPVRGASPRAARPVRRRPERSSASSPKQGFGEFIQSIFGIKPARTSRRTAPGNDKGPQSRVVLSLEDAHKGGIHKITVLERRRCPICRGQKRLEGRTCPACRGSGALHTPINIDVNIPPGARHGSIIKLTNRDGSRDRRPGSDLYVKVVVQPHPDFSIDGDDIYFDVPIAPWEAALGGSVEVAGLDGKLEIRIPEGAQGGKRLRLRGEGLNRRDGGRGDAYVRLNIVVPQNPGEREKSLYRELAKISPFKPRSKGDS